MIGRKSSDLVLPHKEVSRKHAAVTCEGETVFLEDIGSQNGTFLNGTKVEARTELGLGDRLSIGPYDLEIHCGQDIEDGATAKTPAAGILSGRIEKDSLRELLQTLEFNERTGTLAIGNNDGVQGEVVIKNGRPLRAYWGDLRDRYALFQLWDLTQGHYAFSTKVECEDEGTMNLSIAQLLLEAGRRTDEKVGEAPEEDDWDSFFTGE